MNGHIYRYPTFIKNQKSYDIYIGLGAGHTGYTIHTKNINFPLTVSDIRQTNKETIITRDITAHNFTVFKSKYKDILYGIGGLLRDQEPWGQTELDKNSGVYLFKNINNRWDKKSTPIISSYNCPKNAIISIEKKAPEFDSNICCFYSKIFDHYILYCRANISGGHRGTQILTSNNLINWSPFKLLYLDTFKFRENIYMFKCIEIFEKKLFFGLIPFTSSDVNPKIKCIKKIISYDSINWIDYGILCDAPLAYDNSHLNIHIGEIFYDKNKLEIILFHNVYDKDNNVFKLYEFEQENKSFERFIKNIKINNVLHP